MIQSSCSHSGVVPGKFVRRKSEKGLDLVGCEILVVYSGGREGTDVPVHFHIITIPRQHVQIVDCGLAHSTQGSQGIFKFRIVELRLKILIGLYAEFMHNSKTIQKKGCLQATADARSILNLFCKLRGRNILHLLHNL